MTFPEISGTQFIDAPCKGEGEGEGEGKGKGKGGIQM